MWFASLLLGVGLGLSPGCGVAGAQSAQAAHAVPATPAATVSGKPAATGAVATKSPQQPPIPSPVLPPPKDFDVSARSNAVLRHLSAVVRVFRLAAAPIQKVGEASDMLYRDQAFAQATQVADLAFTSGRAEASLLAAYAKQSGAATAAPQEGEAQHLQTMRSSVTQKLADLKAKQQALTEQLNSARAKQRATLQQQQEEIAGDIDLYEAMSDAMKKVAVSSDSGGGGGLAGDIDRLQHSVPELAASSSKALVAAPLSSLNEARSAGVSSQAVVLFQLLGTRHAIDTWMSETEDLHDQAQQLREPLVTLVRSVVASGQALSTETEASAGAGVAMKKPAPQLDVQAIHRRYANVTSTFNALSAAVVPLTQEIITLEQSRANLLAWRGVVDSEYHEVLRNLLLRVLIIAMALGTLFGLGNFWQRATTRYVHDIRRRRQLLVTRRVIISFLSGLILIFGFTTQFSSLATFAGFITAGIAVGLQTILLSVAAYFFIVGRYGVRVGDRITVVGVTGDVIDVGLVRFYMMELAGSGTELQPTGRVAVFANSVLFQSGTPLYRQMPGAEYGWHELSVKLTLSGGYSKASDRLTGLVKEVYDGYRTKIETQHRQVEAWMDSAVPPPAVESRLQLVEGGLQLYVRYPVELRESAAIDQQVTRAVISLMDEDAEIKDAISGAPTIRALTKS